MPSHELLTDLASPNRWLLVLESWSLNPAQILQEWKEITYTHSEWRDTERTCHRLWRYHAFLIMYYIHIPVGLFSNCEWSVLSLQYPTVTGSQSIAESVKFLTTDSLVLTFVTMSRSVIQWGIMVHLKRLYICVKSLYIYHLVSAKIIHVHVDVIIKDFSLNFFHNIYGRPDVILE